MSNSPLILSAITVIALTGITLTSLKYNKNDNEDEIFVDNYHDYDDDNFSLNDTHSNTLQYPKFHYKNINQNMSAMNEKRVVKRSNGATRIVDYSIVDRNLSMIDESRRQKVKEVHIHSFVLLLIKNSCEMFELYVTLNLDFRFINDVKAFTAVILSLLRFHFSLVFT